MIALAGGERVGGAEIGDQAHASALEHGQQQFHAPLEQRIVAAVRILESPQLPQRDRALGQAFEPQILDVAALGQDQRGLQPIALESRAAADAYRAGHCSVARQRVHLGKEQVLPRRGLGLDVPILYMKSAVLQTFCGISV